jgi:hypothetical protein
MALTLHGPMLISVAKVNDAEIAPKAIQKKVVASILEMSLFGNVSEFCISRV